MSYRVSTQRRQVERLGMKLDGYIGILTSDATGEVVHTTGWHKTEPAAEAMALVMMSRYERYFAQTGQRWEVGAEERKAKRIEASASKLRKLAREQRVAYLKKRIESDKAELKKLEGKP